MPIPTGYYELTSQVTFGKEKAWYSFGQRSPIKVMDNVNIDAILIKDTTGEAYDHVTLDGIWMYGNRANQSS